VPLPTILVESLRCREGLRRVAALDGYGTVDGTSMESISILEPHTCAVGLGAENVRSILYYIPTISFH
jgi:hypothetical protein